MQLLDNRFIHLAIIYTTRMITCHEGKNNGDESIGNIINFNIIIILLIHLILGKMVCTCNSFRTPLPIDVFSHTIYIWNLAFSPMFFEIDTYLNRFLHVKLLSTFIALKLSKPLRSWFIIIIIFTEVIRWIIISIGSFEIQWLPWVASFVFNGCL